MYSILSIDGDPVSWVLTGVDPSVVAQQFSQPGEPAALPVEAPLTGRLLLSPRCAGSIAVLRPERVGWIPSGIHLPSPVLYVPSGTGPTTAAPGYGLGENANLAALEQEIMTAMSAGTTVTVPVSDGLFSGSVVLNGAVLPLAVICPRWSGQVTPGPGWQPT